MSNVKVCLQQIIDASQEDVFHWPSVQTVCKDALAELKENEAAVEAAKQIMRVISAFATEQQRQAFAVVDQLTAIMAKAGAPLKIAPAQPVGEDS